MKRLMSVLGPACVLVDLQVEPRLPPLSSAAPGAVSSLEGFLPNFNLFIFPSPFPLDFLKRIISSLLYGEKPRCPLHSPSSVLVQRMVLDQPPWELLERQFLGPTPASGTLGCTATYLF